MSDALSPFRPSSPSSASARAREVKSWVRAASGVGEDVTIMVSELSCSEPGCPPYEVVMALLRPGQPAIQRKLHLRLMELSREDVSALWAPGAIPEHHGHPTDDSAP